MITRYYQYEDKNIYVQGNKEQYKIQKFKNAGPYVQFMAIS